MRILFAIPLVLVAGCNVSNDANNDQVMIQYNEETAQNALEDAGNTAENIGAAIGNEADRAANKIDNSDLVADDNSSETTNSQ
jgi:hypothetical protein